MRKKKTITISNNQEWFLNHHHHCDDNNNQQQNLDPMKQQQQPPRIESTNLQSLSLSNLDSLEQVELLKSSTKSLIMFFGKQQQPQQ
ncbi:hypothetical protein BLA29_014383 [Euroglyphus maynei]|uniref:Uncharacterized protein n=1 Tax=Euroglyphus maynei TaxID=6958 RepID=A0A1Y3ASA8_EURMA|nr:hypothetical protein BLA29_014383 [Euroglyphus maynei]